MKPESKYKILEELISDWVKTEEQNRDKAIRNYSHSLRWHSEGKLEAFQQVLKNIEELCQRTCERT